MRAYIRLMTDKWFLVTVLLAAGLVITVWDHTECHHAAASGEVEWSVCEKPAVEWQDGLRLNWTWR